MFDRDCERRKQLPLEFWSVLHKQHYLDSRADPAQAAGWLVISKEGGPVQ